MIPVDPSPSVRVPPTSGLPATLAAAATGAGRPYRHRHHASRAASLRAKLSVGRMTFAAEGPAFRVAAKGPLSTPRWTRQRPPSPLKALASENLNVLSGLTPSRGPALELRIDTGALPTHCLPVRRTKRLPKGELDGSSKQAAFLFGQGS